MARSSKTVTETIENIGSPHITITEDKLRYILMKHVRRLRKSKEWIGALIAVVSLVATIYACTFSTKLGIDASTWKAIFITAAFIGICYFFFSVFNAIMQNSNEEKIIEEIKTVDHSPKKIVCRSWGFKYENGRYSFFCEKTQSYSNVPEELQSKLSTPSKSLTTSSTQPESSSSTPS